MIGQVYNQRKRTHGGDRKSNPQNEDLNVRECQAVAGELGVGRATVQRGGDGSLPRSGEIDFCHLSPRQPWRIAGSSAVAISTIASRCSAVSVGHRAATISRTGSGRRPA